jgi:(p)ppGpp synthase/HD superfamily hydrolase
VTPQKPDYSEARIREEFGDRVCGLVLELTDTKLEYGNRAARKARDRERLAAASAAAKTIKLADITDNFVDIHKNDPGFARLFAREIELMLPGLSDGDPTLFAGLSALLENYKKTR